MAIGRTFRQAFLKAMRSRELDVAAGARPAARGAARPRRRCPARTATTSCSRRSAAARTSRAPRAHVDRPLVPARARGDRDGSRRGVRGRADVQGRRHLRRRVRGEHALLLLVVGAPDERSGRRRRGRARRAAVGRDPRLRAQPDRPGDRVRLLLRARGDDRARVAAATR